MHTNAANARRAEKSLSFFWESYEAGELDRALEIMQSLNYSPLVLNHVLDPDNYYIPNRRGDKLLKPDSVDEDCIPVIALRDDERVTIPDQHKLHPLQEIALQARGSDSNQIETLNKHAARYQTELSPTTKSGAVASVFSLAFETPTVQGGSRGWRFSPVIILKNDPDDPNNLTNPDTFLHELVHVEQTLAVPFEDETIDLDEELEAYAVQEKMIHSSLEFSDTLAMAGLVMIFYRKHFGLNNSTYKSTPEFEKKIREHPFLHRIIDH